MARRTFQETDAPEHTDIRRFVNPNFAKPVVAKFDSLIRELAAGIIKQALEKSEFDAVVDFPLDPVTATTFGRTEKLLQFSVATD